MSVNEEGKTSRIFTISEEEDKEIDQWKNAHSKKCALDGHHGAIGGQFTFSFTNTKLGQAGKVRCACGVDFDFTDYEAW